MFWRILSGNHPTRTAGPWPHVWLSVVIPPHPRGSQSAVSSSSFLCSLDRPASLLDDWCLPLIFFLWRSWDCRCDSVFSPFNSLPFICVYCTVIYHQMYITSVICLQGQIHNNVQRSGGEKLCVSIPGNAALQAEEVVLYAERNNLPILDPQRNCGLSSLPTSEDNDITSPWCTPVECENCGFVSGGPIVF